MHKTTFITLCFFFIAAITFFPAAFGVSPEGREYHVSVNGDDGNDGTSQSMLRTISAAAALAQPGDTITVHEGVYRESVNPPRGGESETLRITYQAAPNAKVEISGAEVITGWEHVQHDTWKAVVPNHLFGDYNPYGDLIRGDWFNPKGRTHHTGAVYLDGHWLVEAAELKEVLAPAGIKPAWLTQSGQEYLLNVAWLSPLTASPEPPRIPATDFINKQGTQNASCSEGGECIGFIRSNDWVLYKNVDFGTETTAIDVRAASASNGGRIEFRLDQPDGELLGSVTVPHTGGWQSWSSFQAEITPLTGIRDLCLVFRPIDILSEGPEVCLWYAEVDDEHTTLWAQFKDANPNEHLVEINVRPTVFYPEQPGINYITVRGFVLRQAATNWAPPTAEQQGIIGTHWSRGWIIENNDVRYSVCTGIALGKHGDEFDNTSADTAEGYVLTIERAVQRGWNRENIGHHVVRNNTISHCEQAGIVGSLGAIFSTITGNTIHDIHVRKLFTGAEMAGIKLHAAIDVEIRGNHIHNTCLGLWLDWMAQGAHVTGNLLHSNDLDLFVEVNHGPFLVDNNFLLSPVSILNVSRGGAFAHNLMLGEIRLHHYDSRLTPYHTAHSTEIAGMHDNPSGDDRYYNNLFSGRSGLEKYDEAHLPVFMAGNVFLGGSRPSRHESAPLVLEGTEGTFGLEQTPEGLYLAGTFEAAWRENGLKQMVSTALLGKARVSGLPYENPDGSPLQIDRDYFGRPRNPERPFPGPVEPDEYGKVRMKVWPVESPE